MAKYTNYIHFTGYCLFGETSPYGSNPYLLSTETTFYFLVLYEHWKPYKLFRIDTWRILFFILSYFENI